MTPTSGSEAVSTRDLEVLKIERQRTWANGDLPVVAPVTRATAHQLGDRAEPGVLDVIGFEGLEMDPALFELRRGGLRVHLEPQTFDVLAYLIAHRDRVVPKEELMDEVWGGRFITEGAVASRIKEARRAVGDDGHAQRVIQTVHGRGYRFIAKVGKGVVAA